MVQSSTTYDRLFGGAMVIAPILLLASTVAATTGGGLGEDRVGGALQVYAMAAWILVIVGLTRMLQRPFPIAAAVLMAIGALGAAGGIGYGLDSIQNAEFGTTTEDAGAAGPIALQVPGILFPVANIGIGVALMRARVDPRWSGIVLAVAALLFPVSRIGSVEPLAMAVDVLFLIALAPLAWAILQGRDPMATATVAGMRATSLDPTPPVGTG